MLGNVAEAQTQRLIEQRRVVLCARLYHTEDTQMRTPPDGNLTARRHLHLARRPIAPAAHRAHRDCKHPSVRESTHNYDRAYDERFGNSSYRDPVVGGGNYPDDG